MQLHLPSRFLGVPNVLEPVPSLLCPLRGVHLTFANVSKKS